jgi:sarcosine oxidase
MNADVIVIELGAMGSAACYQLAKRGARVIGVDRYSKSFLITPFC